jgi:arylsulfatase A-like enzyme
MSARVTSLASALALLAASLMLSASCHRGAVEASPPLELLRVAYIVFSPGGDDIRSPVALGGESRPGLVAPVPAEFRYHIRIPERGSLTFAIGIASTPAFTNEESLPGNRMRFTVKAGEKRVDDVLFDKEIHVSRRDRWLPQIVDLKRYAGREIWLAFQTSFPGYEPEGEAPPLPLVGVFADPVLHDRAAFGRAKGVVLISIDTLRRDHVSLYGYPRRTTPGLEALAGESVVFDDAISTASWTLPAHASLLTSTYPGVHGAVNAKVGLAPEWPRLPGILKEHGFFTQAMVTHVYLSRAYGFGEGFDRHHYMPETRAEEVTNEAISFLEARGDRDYFLFLHYYDPHWHYDPPKPYDTAFDPTYHGSANGIWWNFKDLDRATIAPRDLHHIEALYDGEILYTDRQLERLFGEMKRLGVYDDSMVIVTSDHGEEFLDHGMWEHQKTLYEEQIRIPLLMKLPGGARGPRRVSGQVSLIDVAPTILDLLGLAAPATFQGRSLLPAVDRGTSDAREAWAETEHTIDGTHKLAVRRGSGGKKAIFSVKENEVALELYDLARDSKETTNLEDPGSREGLDKTLAAYLADVERRRQGKTGSPEVILDRRDLERLRSLGYLK